MCTAMPRRGTGRPQRAGRARRGSRQVTAALQPVHVPRRRPGRLQLGHREARARAARASGLADAGADVEAAAASFRRADRSTARRPSARRASPACRLPPPLVVYCRRHSPPTSAASAVGAPWRAARRCAARASSSCTLVMRAVSTRSRSRVSMSFRSRSQVGGTGVEVCAAVALVCVWRGGPPAGARCVKRLTLVLRAGGTPGDLASRALQTTLQHLVFCRLTQRVYPFDKKASTSRPPARPRRLVDVSSPIYA